MDEHTDTHTRSASFPQAARPTPAFVANEPPTLLPSETHQTFSETPVTTHSFSRDPTLDPPASNASNLKQVYYAEILPDATISGRIIETPANAKQLAASKLDTYATLHERADSQHGQLE